MCTRLMAQPMGSTMVCPVACYVYQEPSLGLCHGLCKGRIRHSPDEPDHGPTMASPKQCHRWSHGRSHDLPERPMGGAMIVPQSVYTLHGTAHSDSH